MKFTKEKLLKIKNQSIDTIQIYLEENYADKIIMSSWEFLLEYISDLETEQELTITLVSEENKPLIETIHNEE